LREVEVHIEPDEILSQALKEGDLDVRSVVRECIYEESAEAVLDCIEHDEIERYCQRHELGLANDFETIVAALKQLSNLEKAKLLWLLLKCEGDHHA